MNTIELFVLRATDAIGRWLGFLVVLLSPAMTTATALVLFVVFSFLSIAYHALTFGACLHALATRYPDDVCRAWRQYVLNRPLAADSETQAKV